jgi:hypothetical protein
MEIIDFVETIKNSIEHLKNDSDKIKSTTEEPEGKGFWKGYKLACTEILQSINQLYDTL